MGKPESSRIGWSIALRLAAVLVCGAASTADAEEFDFAALRALIETHHIRSIEQLLPSLPPAWRYRYVLMFASRSLQDAGYSAPRVILYGPDAHLVLTFNGDPAQRGFDVLESLEFAPDKQFRLREIRFPQADSTEPVSFSGPNPQTCQGCHGSPARPVWDSWPLWPGAYGQRYDAPLSEPERVGLEGFLAQQATHPRYRHLLGTQRLADPQTFHANSRTRYAGTQQVPPNAELTALLSGLGVEALVRQMRERPHFAQYQYALLGVSSQGCGALGDFLPAGLRGAAKAGFARLEDDSAAANRWAQTLKEQRLQDSVARTSAIPPTASRTHSIASANAWVQLRLVAEAGLGMQTQSWTLALEKGTYDFTPAPGAKPSVSEALLSEVAHDDPIAAELSSYATSADGDRYCRYLQHQSVAVLNSAATATSADWSLASSRGAQTGERSAATHSMQLLRLCAACHDTQSAPHIPFLQESALRKALLSETTPHGRLLEEVLFRLSPQAAEHRMPLGIKISDTDRVELQRYFSAMGASAQ